MPAKVVEALFVFSFPYLEKVFSLGYKKRIQENAKSCVRCLKLCASVLGIFQPVLPHAHPSRLRCFKMRRNNFRAHTTDLVDLLFKRDLLWRGCSLLLC